ncbi:hypothetical protein E2320_013053, partial [Naja naja]
MSRGKSEGRRRKRRRKNEGEEDKKKRRGGGESIDLNFPQKQKKRTNCFQDSHQLSRPREGLFYISVIYHCEAH